MSILRRNWMVLCFESFIKIFSFLYCFNLFPLSRNNGTLVISCFRTYLSGSAVKRIEEHCAIVAYVTEKYNCAIAKGLRTIFAFNIYIGYHLQP